PIHVQPGPRQASLRGCAAEGFHMVQPARPHSVGARYSDWARFCSGKDVTRGCDCGIQSKTDLASSRLFPSQNTPARPEHRPIFYGRISTLSSLPYLRAESKRNCGKSLDESNVPFAESSAARRRAAESIKKSRPARCTTSPMASADWTARVPITLSMGNDREAEL